MSGLHHSEQRIQRLRSIQALLNSLRPEAEPDALIVPGSDEPRGNVIIFPGSFNPPTSAHLALLRQAQQFARAQPDPQNWQLFAAFSKHTVDKERIERPLLLDRVDLLQRILQHHLPHTGILLFNRGLYLEEAQGVHSAFPRVRHIFFLMGYDKIVQILDPHYYINRDAALSELFRLAELLVAPRGSGGEPELHALLHQPQNERFAPYIHPLPLDPTYRDVSSTRVRDGLDDADMPEEVHQFIRDTHAYPSSSADYELHIQSLRALGIPLSGT